VIEQLIAAAVRPGTMLKSLRSGIAATWERVIRVQVPGDDAPVVFAVLRRTSGPFKGTDRAYAVEDVFENWRTVTC